MKRKNILVLATTIIVSEAAGLIGAWLTTPAIPAWYASLVKPELTPPSWVFGPVWTTLFILMGAAAYLIWLSAEEMPQNHPMRAKRRNALFIFGLQLAVNTLWSVVFFGQRDPGAALVVVGALWVLIAVKLVLFSQLSKSAALLLVPYFLWVSFAAYLNYAIWVLN